MPSGPHCLSQSCRMHQFFLSRCGLEAVSRFKQETFQEPAQNLQAESTLRIQFIVLAKALQPVDQVSIRCLSLLKGSLQMWLCEGRYVQVANNYFLSQRSLLPELSAFILRLDDVVSIRRGTATNRRRRRDRPRNCRLHLQRVVDVDNIITLRNSFVSVCTGSALIYLRMIDCLCQQPLLQEIPT